MKQKLIYTCHLYDMILRPCWIIYEQKADSVRLSSVITVVFASTTTAYSRLVAHYTNDCTYDEATKTIRGLVNGYWSIVELVRCCWSRQVRQCSFNDITIDAITQPCDNYYIIIIISLWKSVAYVVVSLLSCSIIRTITRTITRTLQRSRLVQEEIMFIQDTPWHFLTERYCVSVQFYRVRVGNSLVYFRENWVSIKRDAVSLLQPLPSINYH